LLRSHTTDLLSYYIHYTALNINNEIRTEQDKAMVYFEVLSQELPKRRGLRKIMKILNPVASKLTIQYWHFQNWNRKPNYFYMFNSSVGTVVGTAECVAFVW